MNQMHNLCLEKAEEPEIKLPTLIGWWRKKGSSRKTSTSASLTTLKPLTMWIATNWKILKDKEYQTTLPVSWETCMWVKKQQLELDMEQWTGSKLGKEYILNLNKLWEVMKKAGTLHAAVHGVTKSQTGLSDWTTTIFYLFPWWSLLFLSFCFLLCLSLSF